MPLFSASMASSPGLIRAQTRARLIHQLNITADYELDRWTFCSYSSACLFLSLTAIQTNQGFDFNKLFKYGIPYLNASEEEKLVKRLEEKQKLKEENNQCLISIPDNDRPQLEEICSRIENFLTSDAKELIIDRCNSFMRRLVYQEARIRWFNKLRIESKIENTWNCLSVQKIGTKEEEEEKEKEKREKEKLELKQAVGLSNLLKKIVESGKIIVGHNMLLDLCHIVHQFFTPLPSDYAEFKTLLHGLFPRLLDTKVLCQSQQFKEFVSSSNLNLLFDIVKKPPFSIPEVESVEGRSYSVSTDKLHEAGYDAYITGLCFIALSNYLRVTWTPFLGDLLITGSPLLSSLFNKLPIARLKDFPYINLVGNDPNPSRDHIFYLTFPKEWKHGDITNLFSPFGGGYVSWLSDTSAYVGLYRREQAGAVMPKLSKGFQYKIQKYTEHQATLQTEVSSKDRKRKLSPCEKADDAKNDEKSGAAENDDDEWQVATGKRRKKRKEQATTGKKAFEENDAWN
ncbi:poly(A)-specific ribonuclease PARN isoform X2 [Cardiocondyla obscurior]|uniref:poly(A)-specific ribonuclease PARN isoform X2 n=1 Tax=Cardiocondyla obscurior TaxID=286306 RepID=UPI0039656B8A